MPTRPTGGFLSVVILDEGHEIHSLTITFFCGMVEVERLEEKAWPGRNSSHESSSVLSPGFQGRYVDGAIAVGAVMIWDVRMENVRCQAEILTWSVGA